MGIPEHKIRKAGLFREFPSLMPKTVRDKLREFFTHPSLWIVLGIITFVSGFSYALWSKDQRLLKVGENIPKIEKGMLISDALEILEVDNKWNYYEDGKYYYDIHYRGQSGQGYMYKIAVNKKTLKIVKMYSY